MLSIIIPQFNKAQMTQDTIDSVIKNTKLPYEIILVDNGSQETISKEYQEKVVYLRLEKNIFFAGGCNAGAAIAKGEILCFLNNDIILNEGWEEVSKVLETNDSVGEIGVKLLYPNNTIQHAGIKFFKTNDVREVCPDHIFRHWNKDHQPSNIVQSLQAVTGALIFLRKVEFETIGGFDTGYINNFEDIDLSFKVRFVLGKSVLYVPTVDIYHLESQTPRDNTNTAFMENHNLFMSRWADKIMIDGDISMLRM